MGIQFNVFYKLIQFCLFKAEFLEFDLLYLKEMLSKKYYYI